MKEFAIATICAGLAACAADTGATEEAEPQILALSSYEASVGSSISMFGTNFPLRDEGNVSLHFVGTYASDNAPAAAIDRVFEAKVVDRSTLRWDTFGPYENPLAPNGSDLGTFNGTVAVRVERNGEQMRESTRATPIALKVGPSIVVRSFQPSTATCAAPVLRALGGFTYRLDVEAKGFQPSAFTYTVTAPSISDAELLKVRHQATDRVDSLGARNDFVLPPVPEGRGSYNLIVRITANGDIEGPPVETAFVITVRRPLDVYYNGNIQIAEIEAPVAVSACQPGGPNGRHVMYMETQSDTRTREYNVNWNENWLNMHTVSSSTSDTEGWHTQNGVGFATTDGQSFRWSLGMMVEVSTDASIGLSELVRVGVNTRTSVNSQFGKDYTTSNTTSSDYQEGLNGGTTRTYSEQDTDQQGGSETMAVSDHVSSTDTISRTFSGSIIAGHYGVFYRQAVRMIRRAALVAYNQCGEATPIGDVDFEDWTWAPDLAIGSECPPLPASNLPAPRCLISPCSGTF